MQQALAEGALRVERLEQLFSLYKEGRLSSEDLEAEIDKAEAATDRASLNAQALGPFDLIELGNKILAFETKIEAYQKIKDLYLDGVIEGESLARSLGVLLAEYAAIEPWANHLRQEIENTPEAIEEARNKALRLAGYHIPTERKIKIPLSPEQLLNKRLRQMAKAAKRPVYAKKQ